MFIHDADISRILVFKKSGFVRGRRSPGHVYFYLGLLTEAKVFMKSKAVPEKSVHFVGFAGEEMHEQPWLGGVNTPHGGSRVVRCLCARHTYIFIYIYIYIYIYNIYIPASAKRSGAQHLDFFGFVRDPGVWIFGNCSSAHFNISIVTF